jgi:hypothetical protein
MKPHDTNEPQDLNTFLRNHSMTPRQLRQCDPATLDLHEARALAVHAWLCAPKGWKQAVLNRLAELQGHRGIYLNV